MGNMAYCRFENTFSDLSECAEHIHDDDLNRDEKRYRKELIQLCKTIVEECEGEEEDEDEDDSN